MAKELPGVCLREGGCLAACSQAAMTAAWAHAGIEDAAIVHGAQERGAERNAGVLTCHDCRNSTLCVMHSRQARARPRRWATRPCAAAERRASGRCRTPSRRARAQEQGAGRDARVRPRRARRDAAGRRAAAPGARGQPARQCAPAVSAGRGGRRGRGRDGQGGCCPTPGCSGWRACGTGAARPCGTACLPRQRPAPAVRMRAILGVAACAHAGAALAPSVKRSCLCACHLSYKHVEGVPCACQRPVLFAKSHCLVKQGLSQLADPPAPPYRQVFWRQAGVPLRPAA